MVLRTIVRQAGQQLGIYASIVQPGRVAVGDVVDIQ
jgi:MOSC domain-containing protein YiiM